MCVYLYADMHMYMTMKKYLHAYTHYLSLLEKYRIELRKALLGVAHSIPVLSNAMQDRRKLVSLSSPFLSSDKMLFKF